MDEYPARMDVYTLTQELTKGEYPGPDSEECLSCHRDISPGDFYTPIHLGPGADTVARTLAQKGEPYEPYESIRVHWACATGDTSSLRNG